MGRYYSGDIEGKFWFAVQASDDADFFGGTRMEPNYISYAFRKQDIKDIELGIKECDEALGDKLAKLDAFFGEGGKGYEGYSDATLAWISTDWNPSNAGFGKGFRRLGISALSVIRYGELITGVHAVSFAPATILGESGSPRFRCMNLRGMPALWRS